MTRSLIRNFPHPLFFSRSQPVFLRLSRGARKTERGNVSFYSSRYELMRQSPAWSTKLLPWRHFMLAGPLSCKRITRSLGGFLSAEKMNVARMFKVGKWKVSQDDRRNFNPRSVLWFELGFLHAEPQPRLMLSAARVLFFSYWLITASKCIWFCAILALSHDLRDNIDRTNISAWTIMPKP